MTKGKKYKLIKNEPFKSIIDDEWKRAKKLLPVLKRKPKFYWVDSTVLRGGHHAECWRQTNRIYIHYMFQDIDHDEFISLLRHEIAHLPQPTRGQNSHGKDFMWWCDKLGGTRYSPDTLRNMIKKNNGEEPKPKTRTYSYAELKRVGALI